MDNPITIRFRFTAEEYRAYKRAYADADRGSLHWFQADSVILSTIMIVLIFIEFRHDGPQFFTCLAAIYVCVVRHLWYRRGLTRFFRQFSAIEYEYQFSAENIIIRRPHCIIKYQWSCVTKAVDSPRGIILCMLRKDECIWIPKAAFGDAEQAKGLEELLKKKVAVFETAK